MQYWTHTVLHNEHTNILIKGEITLNTTKMEMRNEMVFSDVKPSHYNSSFEQAIVRIACFGENANGSSFTRESFEKALPSIKNIPIVALYKDDENDFGGHESSYEIQDGEFKVVYNTFPFGVIPESAKQYYEEVVEFGEVKQYLVSECLLWKRQKSYDLVKENGAYSVSMEIEVSDGHFNDKSIYEIKDFIFTAICVLGKNVQPCFKSAEIKLFSDNSEYSEMLNAYKQFALYSLKGGDDVKEEVMVNEELVQEETIEVVSEVEVHEEVVEEPAQEESITGVDEVEVEEVEQPTEEIETVEVVEEKHEEETVEETIEVVEEPVVEVHEDFEAKFNELQVEYGKLVSKYEEMAKECERLQTFEKEVLLEKRTLDEAELFGKFTMLNGNEEFESLKTNCSQYSLEEIENMCYAMVGRQSFSMKQKTKNHNQTSLKLDFSSKQEKPLAYGGILA